MIRLIFVLWLLVGQGTQAQNTHSSGPHAKPSAVLPQKPKGDFYSEFFCYQSTISEFRRSLTHAQAKKIQTGQTLTSAELEKLFPELSKHLTFTSTTNATFILHGTEPRLQLTHFSGRQTLITLQSETSVVVDELVLKEGRRVPVRRCNVGLLAENPDPPPAGWLERAKNLGQSIKSGTQALVSSTGSRSKSAYVSPYKCVCTFKFMAATLQTEVEESDCGPPPASCGGVFIENPWIGHGGKVQCGDQSRSVRWSIGIDKNAEHNVTCVLVSK
jgi:hypothetical protein